MLKRHDTLASMSDAVPIAPVSVTSGERRVPAALAIAAVLCVAVYLTTGLMLTRQGEFWSPDSAIRFVQMESLRRAGFRDVAVPYPAAAIDPEGRFFPAGPWFHFQRDGRHFLSYLPYFPAASGILYGMFGSAGLIVIPSISGLLAAWITHRVVSARAPGQALIASLAVALGTPLLIYSGVFWDHAPVVALASGALALALGGLDDDAPVRVGRLALAGALLGLGTWLRNEMYLLTVVVAVTWPFAAGRRRLVGSVSLVAGAALTTGLQWMLNARLYGSPLGYKGGGLVSGRIGDAAGAAEAGTLVAWVTDKLGNVYYQFFSPDFYAFNPRAVVFGLTVGVLLLAAGIAIGAGVRRQNRTVILVGGGLAVVTSVLTLSARSSVSGLLPAAPFVVLALIGGCLRPWEAWLWAVCVLFSAALVVTGTHGGLQWGPRYLLPIVPPLIWLAVAALERVRLADARVWHATRSVAMWVLCASIVIQLAGVEYVEFALARNGRVNESLRTAPADVIVTSLEWLALGAGPIYFEKQLLYVTTVDDFRSLVDRLAARQVRRWSYIPQSGGSFGHLIVEEWSRENRWRFETLSDSLVNGIRVVTYFGAPGPP